MLLIGARRLGGLLEGFREIEQERVIEELEKLIQELPPVPKGYAAQLVRGGRDMEGCIYKESCN